MRVSSHLFTKMKFGGIEIARAHVAIKCLNLDETCFANTMICPMVTFM